ncbi:non-specific lipid-transfer protein 4-like [Hordeum vulgare]|nr:non-specific lipid-transfer protein 4-like [Hordeum vulgare]KAI5010982.1 hypothetical protein ZWY2020_013119 [Hordeum vulgare]
MAMKPLVFLVLVVVLAVGIRAEEDSEGKDTGTHIRSYLSMQAGECGRSSADRMALRMAPCFSAADDPDAQPTSSCCAAVHSIGRSPSCLCAVILSNTFKAAGIRPEVAITIPRRCNMADRPIGYKCGDYTMP